MRQDARFPGDPGELPDGGDPRRALLLALLETGLRRVEGRRCVRQALARPQHPAAPVWLAGVGKAAESMALGAYDALGGAIERALLITRDAPRSPEITRLSAEVLIGAHPVPDERSLAAGGRLLAWVESHLGEVEPLIPISGGSSSLVNVPDACVTLPVLEALSLRAFAAMLADVEF